MITKKLIIPYLIFLHCLRTVFSQLVCLKQDPSKEYTWDVIMSLKPLLCYNSTYLFFLIPCFIEEIRNYPHSEFDLLHTQYCLTSFPITHFSYKMIVISCNRIRVGFGFLVFLFVCFCNDTS